MSRDIFPERAEQGFDDIRSDVVNDWQAIEATDNEDTPLVGQDAFERQWNRLTEDDDKNTDEIKDADPRSVFEKEWADGSYEHLRRQGVVGFSPVHHTDAGEDVALPWSEGQKVDITQPLRPWHEW